MESKKNTYTLFILVLYFFIFRDYLEHIIPVSRYVDELLSACAIPLFFLGSKREELKVKKKVPYILLFFLIAFMSTVVYKYQPISLGLGDVFLNIKFWLAIYVGTKLFKRFDLCKYANKISFHVKLITLFYFILFVLGNIFSNLFTYSIRYGLRSTQLFYSHPTFFAANCVLLLAVLICVKTSTRHFGLYFMMLEIMMISTLRSKAIASAILLVMICYFIYIRSKKISWYTYLIFVPLIVYIGWDQIAFYFISDIKFDSARYMLAIQSIQVAIDHFPLGAGGATFGSSASATSYSPLYFAYGIQNVHGLIEGSASSYFADNFWPMLLGQFGFFGLFLYLFAIITLFVRIKKMYALDKNYFVSALFIFSYICICSIAEASFNNAASTGLAIILGMLFSQVENKSILERNILYVEKS